MGSKWQDFYFWVKCPFKSLEPWKGNLWAIPLPFELNFLLHFFLLYFFLSIFFTSTSFLSMDCHLSPGCLWICQYVYIYCWSSSHMLSSSTEKLQTPWHLITFLSLSLNTIIILRARESRTWQIKVLTWKYDVLSLKKAARTHATLVGLRLTEFKLGSLIAGRYAASTLHSNGGKKWAETPQWTQHFRDIIKESSERKQLNSATHDLNAHISF